jgi:glycosyltransferase involved in cell wall biosynthesis
MPDDGVVVLDDNSDNVDTIKILGEYENKPKIRVFKHGLDNNYGAHKNFGNEQCSGEYIFQLDGDELPSELTVGENLHAIIASNSGTELIYVPRINDYLGVTPQHALQWNWRLSESSTLKRPLVNWPDPQGRIYKKEPERIRWDRRLHEKIEGHQSYAFLPADDESFAIWHRKTIEKQLQTNYRYNTAFTQTENMGHKVV